MVKEGEEEEEEKGKGKHSWSGNYMEKGLVAGISSGVREAEGTQLCLVRGIRWKVMGESL